MMIDTADTTDDHFTIGTNVCVVLRTMLLLLF